MKPDALAYAALVGPQLAMVEAKLAESATFPDEFFTVAAQHLLTAGGKRLRPTLVLLAARLGEEQREAATSGTGREDDAEAPETSHVGAPSGANGQLRATTPSTLAPSTLPPSSGGLTALIGLHDDVMSAAIDAAVAVELTHLATLYHDDVIDSAPIRRGAPSAHELWGNTAAILIGDLLFARTSQLVATLGPEAVLRHAQTFEALCAGQLRESLGPAAGEDPVEHYLAVLADKTASLLATAAWFGAHVSGLAPEQRDALTRYAQKLGMAFQLSDDVLDLTSSAQMAGKLPGIDLREGVPTMPVLLLRERVARGLADAADLALLARLDGDLSDDAALAAAVTVLAAHPVVAETRALVHDWVERAVAELVGLPDGEIKAALVQVAKSVADRVACDPNRHPAAL